MNLFLHAILATILLFGGCRSSGKTQDSADSNIAQEAMSLKALALEKLGEGAKMESSDNWVLCTKEIGQRQLVFFVYDKNKEQIVYDEKSPVRSVVWSSDNAITVQPYDRTPSEEKNDYSIDLRTLKKTNPKKSY
jgi:hypothetical protein